MFDMQLENATFSTGDSYRADLQFVSPEEQGVSDNEHLDRIAVGQEVAD